MPIHVQFADMSREKHRTATLQYRSHLQRPQACSEKTVARRNGRTLICVDDVTLVNRSSPLQRRFDDSLRSNRLRGGNTCGLALRRRREVLTLDFGRRGAATVVVDGLLSLGGVLLSGFTEDLGRVSGALSSKIAKLSGLLVGANHEESAKHPHFWSEVAAYMLYPFSS